VAREEGGGKKRVSNGQTVRLTRISDETTRFWNWKKREKGVREGLYDMLQSGVRRILRGGKVVKGGGFGSAGGELGGKASLS